MTHASLFSGIGGFDLAADWAGWENIFHCEINPFCQKVLNYYWPKAISHDNIKTTDFTVYRGTIDILTGGFPCQPYSSAGKRLGKEDERHLWPEMLRAIREIQPRWIVGENVFGIVNWSHGLVFDEVQADLEAEGYEVQAFILPACAVGAPHRRDRVWFVAHTARFDDRRNPEEISSSNGGQNGKSFPKFGSSSKIFTSNTTCSTNRKLNFKDRKQSNRFIIDFSYITTSPNPDSSTVKKKITEWKEYKCERRKLQFEFNPINATSPNPRNTRLQGNEQYRTFNEGETWQHAPRSTAEFCKNNDWQQFPTQPPVCGGDDGIPAGLAGITIPKHRQESLKAYGNAIVPQVAYRIFDSINQYENIVSK